MSSPTLLRTTHPINQLQAGGSCGFLELGVDNQARLETICRREILVPDRDSQRRDMTLVPETSVHIWMKNIVRSGNIRLL